MIKKNDIVPVTIESISNDGNGVSHYDGFPIFIPESAPGDIIDVKIVKVLSNYCFGIIEKIIQKSHYRIENDCHVYHRCGGCCLRHISYEEELRQKESWVKNAIKRIASLDFPVNQIIPSPNVNYYRNKVEYPFTTVEGQVCTGFYAKRSHITIPSEQCLLQPSIFDAISKAVCQWANQHQLTTYNEQTNEGLLRHLYIRMGFVSNDIMVCLVINGVTCPYQDTLLKFIKSVSSCIKSIVVNYNTNRDNRILGFKDEIIYGSNTISDNLLGNDFQISPLSFFQVNHDCTELLYSIAKKYAELKEKDTLLDLYCGIGTIGISMVNPTNKLIGVEIIPSAIENAISNANKAGLSDYEFICCDAKNAMKTLLEKRLKPDVIVVDPPRKGCDSETIESIIQMNPSRLIIISCNPSTLARDLKELMKSNYRLKAIQPVDMFPRTNHVETVCLLSKVNTRDGSTR